MFIIQPITKDQVNSLEGKLAQNQTSITGSNPYTIVGHGITATVIFDETLGSLAVTIVHKPFFIPESAIQDGIEKALKS